MPGNKPTGLKKKGTGAATSTQAGRAKPAQRATVDGTRGRGRGRTTVSHVASPIPSAHSEESSSEEVDREEELVLEEERATPRHWQHGEGSSHSAAQEEEEELEEGEYEVEVSAEDMEWPVPRESKIWLRGVSALPSRPYPHKGLIVKPIGAK